MTNLPLDDNQEEHLQELQQIIEILRQQRQNKQEQQIIEILEKQEQQLEKIKGKLEEIIQSILEKKLPERQREKILRILPRLENYERELLLLLEGQITQDEQETINQIEIKSKRNRSKDEETFLDMLKKWETVESKLYRINGLLLKSGFQMTPTGKNQVQALLSGSILPALQKEDLFELIPDLRQKEANVQTVLESLNPIDQKKNEILNILQELREHQKRELITIFHDRRDQKLQQALRQQLSIVDLQQISDIIHGNKSEEEQAKEISEKLKSSTTEEQELQKILRIIQRREQKLLEQQITTTEDVKNKVDEVIKKLVQQIEQEINSNKVKQLNQKLDKLIELKEVFEYTLNLDSIKTIIKEFINHDDPKINSLVTRDKDDQGKALITNAARYLYLLRNSSQSLEDGKIHDPALGLELFRTYRSRIEHEDTVLSQRINWFLVTQGFLFAAFATTLSIEIIAPLVIIFMLLISITGWIYSYRILNPIALSLVAIRSIEKEWKDRLKKELATSQVYNLLPQQFIFDSELEPYLPDYYKKWKLFKPKCENYRKHINRIPQTTAGIWFFIFILICIEILFGTSNWLDYKLFNPKYLLTINYSKSSQLEAHKLKKLIDSDQKINQGVFKFKTTVCQHLNSEDNDEYVLAITQKDNSSFFLSKKQYKSTKKSWEYKSKKIKEQIEEDTQESNKQKSASIESSENDQKPDYSKIEVKTKIKINESTICSK